MWLHNFLSSTVARLSGSKTSRWHRTRNCLLESPFSFWSVFQNLYCQDLRQQWMMHKTASGTSSHEKQSLLKKNAKSFSKELTSLSANCWGVWWPCTVGTHPCYSQHGLSLPVAGFQGPFIQFQKEGRRLWKIRFHTVLGLDQHGREDRLTSFKEAGSFLGDNHIVWTH